METDCMCYYSCFFFFCSLLFNLAPAHINSIHFFLYLSWTLLLRCLLLLLLCFAFLCLLHPSLRSQWVWLRAEWGVPPLSRAIKAMPTPRLHMSSRPSKRGGVLLIRSVSRIANTTRQMSECGCLFWLQPCCSVCMLFVCCWQKCPWCQVFACSRKHTCFTESLMTEYGTLGLDDLKGLVFCYWFIVTWLRTSHIESSLFIRNDTEGSTVSVVRQHYGSISEKPPIMPVTWLMITTASWVA